MVEQTPDGTRKHRQYRVTVTDATSSPTLRITLSWRTFPCTAEHWDGHYSAEVPKVGRIRSVDSELSLREVLMVLASQAWKRGSRQ